MHHHFHKLTNYQYGVPLKKILFKSQGLNVDSTEPWCLTNCSVKSQTYTTDNYVNYTSVRCNDWDISWQVFHGKGASALQFGQVNPLICHIGSKRALISMLMAQLTEL